MGRPWLTVVGLGASGRAAVKLALARDANVLTLDLNPSCLPLEEESALEGYALKRVRTELGPHNKETLLKPSKLLLFVLGVPAFSELGYAEAALSLYITSDYT